MTLWLLSDDAAWPMGEWVSTYELDRTKGYIVHPAPPDSLYGVRILEVIEHITSDRPYRICTNETCGRLFSVQEGRSRYGGHRTENVKFHTPACKAAQAAREYRRRQAEKRKEKRR